MSVEWTVEFDIWKRQQPIHSISGVLMAGHQFWVGGLFSIMAYILPDLHAGLFSDCIGRSVQTLMDGKPAGERERVLDPDEAKGVAVWLSQGRAKLLSLSVN